jgi:hypothetical protein
MINLLLSLVVVLTFPAVQLSKLLQKMKFNSGYGKICWSFLTSVLLQATFNFPFSIIVWIMSYFSEKSMINDNHLFLTYGQFWSLDSFFVSW